MAEKSDYYSVLGVSRTADDSEIRAAYRKLARRYHPDVNADDADATEKFKQVSEAWNVLSDPEKRANYDQYGSAQAPQFATGDPGTQTWRWSGNADEPLDLEELFGGFRQSGGHASGGYESRRWPQRGPDIRANIVVPFQVAAVGGQHDLHMTQPGTEKTETITVNIPEGVDTGSVIRLTGLGSPGRDGGAAGDLLVWVTVSPHPWFRRDGADILLDLPLSLTEAALGTKVEIPTLRDGTVILTVPAGTSSGARLRLRGKGILDRTRNHRGDQYAIIKVSVPKDINESSRKLLTELQAEMGHDPRSGLWTS